MPLFLRSLRGQAIVGAVLLVVLFLCAAGGGILALQAVGGRGQDLFDALRVNRDHVLPVVRGVDALRLDVVQVQQWLTDISATRGQDGLNDGKDKAATYAASFTDHLIATRSHAERLKLGSLVVALDKVNAAFGPYYTLGQRMAEAYISQGTTAGNQAMGDFDATATTLDEALTALIGEVAALDKTDFARLEELHEQTRRSVLITTAVMGVLLVLGLGVSLFIGRQLFITTRGILRAARVLNAAADGDLHVRIDRIWRRDELGQVQRAVNTLLDSTEAFVCEAQAAMSYASRGEYFRRIVESGSKGAFLAAARSINQALETMDTKISAFRAVASDFETSVKETVGAVAASAHELHDLSEHMRGLAQENSSRSTSAAAAVEEASADVQAVAGASTELAASVAEITRQIAQASDAAAQAVTRVDAANTQVGALSEAAQRIGAVVQLITAIASQTNLLALNATIEAARAGEAGKGFAVVAGEVKALATQTAKATEDISGQVGAIQSATQAAVDAIAQIGSVIAAIDRVVSTVAAAAEEQHAATNEISGRVEHVAVSTQRITEDVGEVKIAAAQSGTAARTVLDSADQMTQAAGMLHASIDDFFQAMRQAV